MKTKSIMDSKRLKQVTTQLKKSFDNWGFNKAIVILAIILLSSCYHTKIKVTDDDCKFWYNDPIEHIKVDYTNTSSSKYLEVTIREEDSVGEISTHYLRLKPGEIKTLCKCVETNISVVGEREIKSND